ncbi:MAG: poly-gamma-glutamate system protein [Sorangiineae bacterium]|nr:poly-gamma-glutamate system protein [Polyangiaceae bacterium]MEB2321040.1 poly-gamma-glutamate system protein [Sorangiineae bacterium]
MKRVYWRPPGVSRAALTMIALIALIAVVAVEALPVQEKQRYYAEKIAAAKLALRAMAEIKAEKARLGLKPDPEGDPYGTGLIGVPLSAVTSNTGYLTAKQTSVNPNFAAVVVHLLKRAGVAAGDTVALGVSGSFPALNIDAFAACQVLGLKPIVIASASASEWGANNPEFLWIDMEHHLSEKGLFGFRSVAASLGGIDDKGFGMSKEGRSLLDAAIERNGLEKITPRSIVDSIDKRLSIYERLAGDRPIKAYVNVGGGTASVGTHVGKKEFEPGLNLAPPRKDTLMDSVMLRFAERDVPVIHLTNITKLAENNGLPLDPKGIPPVGEGTIYVRAEYNRWLAGAGLAVVFAAMLAFIRLDVGSRLLATTRKKRDGTQPQQMI